MPLTGISAQISGDFRINSGCAATLAAHSTCGFTIVYLPTVAGPETGTLVVTDSLGSQTVTLSGTGLSGATDSLSPTSLTFPGQPVNTPSTAQSITLSNTGDTTLDQISATITGDFLLKSGCNKTLAPKTSCDLSITYQPTQPGQSSGTLTVTDGLRSQTVPLSGNASDFQILATTDTTSTITSGQTATFGAQLNSLSGFAGAGTFACTGAPLNAVCSLDASSFNLTSGATQAITIKISTGGAVPVAVWRNETLGPLRASCFLFAGALPFCIRRRKTARWALAMACSVLIAGSLLSGCGAGASGATGNSGGSGTNPPPTGSTNATPPGTYALTVSANSAQAVRTLTVTVIVK